MRPASPVIHAAQGHAPVCRGHPPAGEPDPPHPPDPQIEKGNVSFFVDCYQFSNNMKAAGVCGGRIHACRGIAPKRVIKDTVALPIS